MVMFMTKKSGFTLIEVLFTFGILAFCICGVLLTYLQMLILTDLSRDLTLATNAVVAKMEELKKTSYDNLLALDGSVFDINGFTGADAKGRIEVSDVTVRSPSPTETLKKARIVVCFKSRGRVIGEDRNLNGRWDAGEDQNGTGYAAGRLDAPIELVTLIAK